MSRLPEFKQMSKKVKEDLVRRFRPEFCPNCGRGKEDIKVAELISSLPCWNVDCPYCGAIYSVRITT